MILPTGTPLDRVPDDLLAEALTALIADRVGTDEADELMDARTPAEIRAEVIRLGGWPEIEGYVLDALA